MEKGFAFICLIYEVLAAVNVLVICSWIDKQRQRPSGQFGLSFLFSQ